VVALVPSAQYRAAGYRAMLPQWHATGSPQGSRRGLPSSRRHCASACAVALALAVSGCGFSYQLDNLFAKKEEGAGEHAGSLRLVTPKPAADPPAEADLAAARAAASEVLTKGGKDVSMPWENPRTGARGTITPLASAYRQDGTTCRDFLASYVKNGTEAWLHGAACRAERGKWVVRTLRPWNNT
jgi:17 kDa outer membrane surface antigen